MNLERILYIIRAIGFSGIFRTIQYAISRDRIDKQTITPPVPETKQYPGKTTSVNPVNGGIRVGFEIASVEVEFLTPNMIRVSWEPGNPPLPYTLAKLEWDPQFPQIITGDSDHALVHGDFQVKIDYAGGICFYKRTGNVFRKDEPPWRVGNKWTLSTRLDTDEHIYGLGERASELNLRPGDYRSWNTDAGGNYSHGADPLYIGTPVYLCISKNGNHLVYYENSFSSTFHIKDTFDASFAGGMLRYYVIFGSLETIYSQLSELLGLPCMPPRWVLGYHQCRWGYRNEADIRGVVQGFEEHDFPLSAIHLDIDYMDKFRLFTFSPTGFPNIKKLAKDLDEKGIKVIATINPAVKIDMNYQTYLSGLASDVFCKLPNGNQVVGTSWPGWSVFPDFTNPGARVWWQEQYQFLMDNGISGIWHDMNEPVSFAAWGDKTFPISTRHSMESHGSDHLEAHNLYGLLMTQAAYQALKKMAPDKRPWIFSRSGWAGLQRYAWNWTGDVETSWEALQQTIPTILGLSLSGHVFSGVDIGGFSGSPDAELYLRWFQMSTFLPLFRTHSSVSTKPREPWVFGEPTTSIVRKFLKLRYSLIPYLYTLVWETTVTGMPAIRPVWWVNPEAQNLWDVSDEFMVGNSLLIAPIMHSNEQHRRIILPDGRWYSFWDDRFFYQGPTDAEITSSLDTTPVFVKGGSILSMDENGELQLLIYPIDDLETSTRVYSDAGDGYGPWRVDTYQASFRPNRITITWLEEGKYPFPYQRLRVQVHGKKLLKAIIGGIACPIENNSVGSPKFRLLTIEVE